MESRILRVFPEWIYLMRSKRFWGNSEFYFICCCLCRFRLYFAAESLSPWVTSNKSCCLSMRYFHHLSNRIKLVTAFKVSSAVCELPWSSLLSLEQLGCSLSFWHNLCSLWACPGNLSHNDRYFKEKESWLSFFCKEWGRLLPDNPGPVW